MGDKVADTQGRILTHSLS